MSQKISAERTPADNSAEKPIRERQLSAYHRALDYVEGLRILELGCGEGIGASLLCSKAASVIALDYSEEALDLARHRYDNLQIDFRLMRVPPILFPQDSFDAVICFQMIEHLKRPEELVAEIKRVLVDGGCALIATVNREETITPNPYHLHEFSGTEFKALLESCFAEVEFYGVFGDEVFTRYWQNNRRWVNNFMKLDFFRISDRLPRQLKVRLFDMASRLMRASLRHKDPHLCSKITYRNFIYQPDKYNGCLDFFAVCRKPGK